jgi:predicted RNase H-like HicB family nuclease
MLTEYIDRAMRHAHYELMENGHFWGEIPPLQGVWAEGTTLEECRETLREVLEDWLLIGLRHGHSIPVIEGIDLNRKAEAGTVAN